MAVNMPATHGYKLLSHEDVLNCSANKVAVVTGGSSPVGTKIVELLARAGVKVYLTAADVKDAVGAAERIRLAGVKGELVPWGLDLADLANVQHFAEAFHAAEARLDMLVLQEVAPSSPTLQHTGAGFERQMGINYYGHFVLTQALLGSLEHQALPGRVVVMCSERLHRCRVQLDDLHWHRRRYRSAAAFAQSQLALALFAWELNRRVHQEGRNVLVLLVQQPGEIRSRALACVCKRACARALTGWVSWQPSVEQAAARALYACTALELHGYSGSFLRGRCIACPCRRARDATLAARLWEETEHDLVQLELAHQVTPRA